MRAIVILTDLNFYYLFKLRMYNLYNNFVASSYYKILLERN